MSSFPDDYETLPVGGYGWPRPIGRIRKWVLRIVGILAAIGILTILIVYAYYSALAEQEDISTAGEMPERSMVFSRSSGAYLGELHGANRVIIPMEGVSPLFKDALLAREDTRFYKHNGIDTWGVIRATVRNIKEGRAVQGASTLTMQLARVSYDIRDKSLHRKLLEMMLARRIERNYSKDEILTLYMNRIYFGSGIYGIERAANSYFGKKASELTLGEAAMLAGIIRGPNRFSPFRHYEDALRERDTVLNRMLKLDFITEDEALVAKRESIIVLEPGYAPIFQNSYVLSQVRKELNNFLEQKDTEEGGLKIYVTIDDGLQKKSEQAMEQRLQALEARSGFTHQTKAEYDAMVENLPDGAEKPLPEYLQGALVAINNRTGGIQAMVGGRDFEASQYNRATMGRRQIGSLFKAFVYAKAYERGLWPLTQISDDPVAPSEVPWWNGTWSPRNSDGKHLGYLPAEEGLIRSRNTMTVRVGEVAGFEDIWSLAESMGLKMPEEKSPLLYIGNVGTDLQNITQGFMAFPLEGAQLEPYLIEMIQDRRGNVLYRHEASRTQLMAPGAAWLASQTLQKVMEGDGTGAAARNWGLEGPAGGKTGTTDAYHDAWFVGYNSSLTCGVWVGLDQPDTILSQGYASSIALPIWTDAMKYAQQHQHTSTVFPSSLDFAAVSLCAESGKLAGPVCVRKGAAYQMRIPYELMPPETCTHEGRGGLFQRKRADDGEKKGFFERIFGGG